MKSINYLKGIRKGLIIILRGKAINRHQKVMIKRAVSK